VDLSCWRVNWTGGSAVMAAELYWALSWTGSDWAAVTEDRVEVLPDVLWVAALVRHTTSASAKARGTVPGDIGLVRCP